MKVFMSWSGQRSKAAAELLHDWIKCVVQASRPWISTRGIGRGSVWFSEINNELKDTAVGIVCLTHQNKNAPWILFESGALAKGLTTTKVCTFLVDLSPSDVQDPLAQFNHTMPTKDGMMSLAATLNSALDLPLDNATLTSVFEAFWPQFERNFAALLELYPQEVVVEARSESSMLEEILESTRGLAQRMRKIEERQTGRDASIAVRAYPFPTATVQSGDDPSSSMQVSTVEFGLSQARDLAATGMPRNEVFSKIFQMLGPKRAQQVFDAVDQASPPIHFIG
jgi:hypothetical protein